MKKEVEVKEERKVHTNTLSKTWDQGFDGVVIKVLGDFQKEVGELRYKHPDPQELEISELVGTKDPALLLEYIMKSDYWVRLFVFHLLGTEINEVYKNSSFPLENLGQFTIEGTPETRDTTLTHPCN